MLQWIYQHVYYLDVDCTGFFDHVSQQSRAQWRFSRSNNAHNRDKCPWLDVNVDVSENVFVLFFHSPGERPVTNRYVVSLEKILKKHPS